MKTTNDSGDSREIINAVLEWTKQITTLATGTLVLSATFITDILKGRVELEYILISSWVLFALSALFGILLMGNLCFLFSFRNKEPPSIYGTTTRVIANLHFWTFLIGLVGFVYFASANFLNREKPAIPQEINTSHTTEPISNYLGSIAPTYPQAWDNKKYQMPRSFKQYRPPSLIPC